MDADTTEDLSQRHTVFNICNIIIIIIMTIYISSRGKNEIKINYILFEHFTHKPVCLFLMVSHNSCLHL